MKLAREVRHKSEDIDDAVLLDLVKPIEEEKLIRVPPSLDLTPYRDEKTLACCSVSSAKSVQKKDARFAFVATALLQLDQASGTIAMPLLSHLISKMRSVSTLKERLLLCGGQ